MGASHFGAHWTFNDDLKFQLFAEVPDFASYPLSTLVIISLNLGQQLSKIPPGKMPVSAFAYHRNYILLWFLTLDKYSWFVAS